MHCFQRECQATVSWPWLQVQGRFWVAMDSTCMLIGVAYRHSPLGYQTTDFSGRPAEAMGIQAHWLKTLTSSLSLQPKRFDTVWISKDSVFVETENRRASRTIWEIYSYGEHFRRLDKPDFPERRRSEAWRGKWHGILAVTVI